MHGGYLSVVGLGRMDGQSTMFAVLLWKCTSFVILQQRVHEWPKLPVFVFLYCPVPGTNRPTDQGMEAGKSSRCVWPAAITTESLSKSAARSSIWNNNVIMLCLKLEFWNYTRKCSIHSVVGWVKAAFPPHFHYIPLNGTNSRSQLKFWLLLEMPNCGHINMRTIFIY